MKDATLPNVKRCPCCNLPMTRLGATVAASTDDKQRHGMFGLCHRCAAENQRLPRAILFKRLDRAGDRALANPERYLCAMFPDAGAARVAVGLLGHPAHVQETRAALGWGDGIDGEK